MSQKKDEINHVVQDILEKFNRIDILVNNAGIYPLKNLVDMSEDFLQKIFDINVFGMFRCTKAVLPTMIKQRYGKIVNVSSVTGPLVAEPGETAYAATKAAVWGFTIALALEVAQYGINVNCICPGYIDTEGIRETFPKDKDPEEYAKEFGRKIPMCRLGTSEEVGNLVLFLVSDESKYITGTHVVIDGGNILQELFSGPYASK